MQIFAARAFDPPGDVPGLRAQVRALVAAHEQRWTLEQRTNNWFTFDGTFSRAMGAAGFVGMTWPKRYGGHERHPLERYVVLEEMLALGAPVGLHWIADRQTGPLLLRYGTETQRQKYLPGMASGQIYACIGLSEPNAGSDLASVRTSARRTPEGWRVNGQKVWTSGAHHCHAALTLVRTEEGSQRHAGLSQLMIDLDTPGITVRPIVDMTGTEHFNEIFFEDVLLPLDALVGTEGDGWKQVTAELALERSGPERYLSCYALLAALIDAVGPEPDDATAQAIGRLTSELWTLRQMSMACAAKLAAGEDPMVEAALVKDLGNAFEQELPRVVQALITDDLADHTDLARLTAWLLVASPSFSLRGGTPEVLRGIIARGLGVR